MPGTGISEFRGNIELVAQRNLRRTSHFILAIENLSLSNVLCRAKVIIKCIFQRLMEHLGGNCMRICFTGGIIFAISAMLDDDTIAQASTCLWHSWDYKVMFCGGFIYLRRVFSF